MVGMSVQERISDIAKRANVSPEMVRCVLNAETDSIVESLERGERATLVGRVTMRPELRSKLVTGGVVRKSIKVNLMLASQIEERLAEAEGFKSSDDSSSEAIRANMEQLGNSLPRMRTERRVGIMKDDVLG